MLRLRTFGGLSVESDTSTGSVTTNRRSLALLALLAVNGGRGVSRDTIVALLWPESNAERGRNSLSQVTSVLRRELAADDLLLGTTELRLNPKVLACDLLEFEHCIATDDLKSAIALYTGPFLDGVFLRNAPEFERWVDHERSRLQQAQCDALERLATRATSGRDYVDAVRLWHRRAGLVPTDSRAARGLMEALVASGDPAGALAHYRVHQSLLHNEMGLEPDEALVRLAESVRKKARLPTETSAPAGPDVGELVTVSAEPIPSEPAIVLPTTTRRKPAFLLMTAAALGVAGIAATWGATNGRFAFGPPAPPAHDSLRLRIVTASIHSGPEDATLARSVRDAALAEMEKDPWLFVVTPGAFVQLAPMIGVSEAALSQADTIRKYARKLRTHAILDFGLSRAGSGYVITAEARSASTDSSLGVIVESASGPGDLSAAMTRTGEELRARLVAARSALAPTKWSANTGDQPAEAIALYIEARSEASRRNYIESARRAKLATDIDSTFAQAWRLVHSSLSNAGLSVDDQLNAISAAFRFSDRVKAPYWRLDIVSAYYRAIGDYERALVFYDSLAPTTPHPNAGLAYTAMRKYDLATRGYRRVVDAAPRRSITEAHPPLVSSLLEEGKVAEAEREVAEMIQTDSLSRRTFQSRAFLFGARRDWQSLDMLGKSFLAQSKTAVDSGPGLRWVGEAAIRRGEFEVFDDMARLTAILVRQHGSPGDYIAGQLRRAQLRATVAGDTARARAIADSALTGTQWDLVKPMDRPYLPIMLYLASVGDVKLGAAVAREWSRITPTEFKRRDSLRVLVGRGELALASGNPREALRLFHVADVRDCQPCFFPRYARAFDALGGRDSARTWYERYASAVAPWHDLDDAMELPHTYLRLGELYEERHEVSAAVDWYEHFVNLWANSDTPALQAKVREVRGRVDSLRKKTI